MGEYDHVLLIMIQFDDLLWPKWGPKHLFQSMVINRASFVDFLFCLLTLSVYFYFRLKPQQESSSSLSSQASCHDNCHKGKMETTVTPAKVEDKGL